MKLDEIDKISNSVQIILQAAEKKRDTLLQTPMAAYLHSKQEGFQENGIYTGFICACHRSLKPRERTRPAKTVTSLEAEA